MFVIRMTQVALKVKKFLSLPQPRDLQDPSLAQLKLVLGSAHCHALHQFNLKRGQEGDQQ